MKDCILIVEPISTGFNYVLDTIKRGYQPLILFPKIHRPEKEVQDYEKTHRSSFRQKLPPEIIEITDTGDYDELLAEIKKYPVVCVALASEVGAELADQIAHDLGLPGNPPESSELHRNKDKMQQRLKERNLPHIRGRLVYSVEEAEEFLNEYNLTDAVVKPVDGAGSVGVHLCHGKDEILDIAKKSLTDEYRIAIAGNRGDGGQPRSALIQELLVGTEYIVNTVSREGRHYITDMWRYDKIPVANGRDGNAYNYARLVTSLSAREYELCQYALKVVEALDIQYGPSHGEYMLTEHGPVLIELGARPMGAGMPKVFLDTALGHHITDRALDSYFDEDLFMSQLQKPYQPPMEAMLKLILIEKDVDFNNVPLLSIINNLESVLKTNLGEIIYEEKVLRSIDFDTNGGMIFMCHADSRVLEHDYTVLRNLEQSLPDLLYRQVKTDRAVFDENEMREYFENYHMSGRKLLFIPNESAAFNYTDAENDVVTMNTAFSIKERYDTIFIWPKGLDCADEEKIAAVSAVLRRLKAGGTAVIPEKAVCDFPYEKAGIITVLESNNVCVQMPSYLTEGYIIGRKAD